MSNVTYFYPRSPCGERHAERHICADLVGISIHVPLAGNVEVTCPYGTQEMAFLSTFPLRGTSFIGIEIEPEYFISIHVPLAGNVTRQTWKAPHR